MGYCCDFCMCVIDFVVVYGVYIEIVVFYCDRIMLVVCNGICKFLVLDDVLNGMIEKYQWLEVGEVYCFIWIDS